MSKQAIILATSWMPKPLTNKEVRTLVHEADVREFDRIQFLLRQAGIETGLVLRPIANTLSIIFWALHDSDYKLKS
jgi:hypothetical protein